MIPPTLVRLKDFIYVDKRRVESFYAQMNKGLQISAAELTRKVEIDSQESLSEARSTSAKERKTSQSTIDSAGQITVYSIIDDFIIDKVEGGLSSSTKDLRTIDTELESNSSSLLGSALVKVVGYLDASNTKALNRFVSAQIDGMLKPLSKDKNAKEFVDQIRTEFKQLDESSSSTLDFQCKRTEDDEILAAIRIQPQNLRMSLTELIAIYQGNRLVPLTIVGTIAAHNPNPRTIEQLVSEFVADVNSKKSPDGTVILKDAFEALNRVKSFTIELGRSLNAKYSVRPLYIYQPIDYAEIDTSHNG